MHMYLLKYSRLTNTPILPQILPLVLADLISLEDAMEELELGPNGGLVYCMEYLLDNMDWLKDELDKFDDEEYIIFDCPGQVAIFSNAHMHTDGLQLCLNEFFACCDIFGQQVALLSSALQACDKLFIFQ